MKNLNSLLFISANLLLKVKMKEVTTIEEQELRNKKIQNVHNELKSDNAKKTFWINIYNAYFQILSNREKSNSKSIFTKKIIIIAQTRLSLDDIEHGILRKYRWKYSFGYLPNPLTSRLIRDLALKNRDYRIHFALNCGAKSCPPIAFYTITKIESQLNDAMHSFIIGETAIDMNNKIIKTSKLIHWYRGDFGGSLGIKKILQEVLGLQLLNYKLNFNEYSRETNLENYKN